MIDDWYPDRILCFAKQWRIKQKFSKPEVAFRPGTLTKINPRPTFSLELYSWLQGDIYLLKDTFDLRFLGLQLSLKAFVNRHTSMRYE